MRTFCQLIFHLLVNLKFLLQCGDFIDKLLIFKYNFLSLLSLILKFASKLMILQHGEPGGGVKLLFLQRQQVSPHFSDFSAHF
jgi:hypothetical protein